MLSQELIGEDLQTTEEKYEREILYTFQENPLKKNEYYNYSLVKTYVDLILSLKNSFNGHLRNIADIEEFKTFRKENPITFHDAHVLDQKLFGPDAGGPFWRSAYSNPDRGGIFTF